MGIDFRNRLRVLRHGVRPEGIKIGGGYGGTLDEFQHLRDRRRIGHEFFPVVPEGDHRKLEVDAAGIFFDQLVDSIRLGIPHGKKYGLLIRGLQELLQPVHGFGVQKNIRPFHVFVAAQEPGLALFGRVFLDFLQDELPLFLGGQRRLDSGAVTVVFLVTKGAFDRAGFPQADGNFAFPHLLP